MFLATPGKRRTIRVYQVLLVFSLLVLSTGIVTVQAAQPYLSGDRLVMPVVLVYDTPYRVEWQVVDSDGNIDLLLSSAEELDSADTTGAPSFFGDVLNIPRLDLDGLSLWGEFYLYSDQPVRFRLQAAAANDAGSSGVQGKWRIIEEIDARDCDEGELIEIYSLRVQQQGAAISVITSTGTYDGTLQGTTLNWSGAIAEDGGTTTTQIQVQFADTLDSLVGSSTWSWSNGSVSCDGSSTITGTLLHN